MPFTPLNSHPLPKQVAAARRHFQASGWSYRTAAPRLGRSYQHLCEVLNGRRQSKSLIQEILKLPVRK